MSNPYGGPPPFPNQPDPTPYGQVPGGFPHAYQQLPTVPRSLAKTAIWLAVAYTVAHIATAATSYPSAMATNEMATSPTPGETTLVWLATGFLLSIGTVILMISIYVLGCLWLQRSYEFAVALRPTYHLRRSKAWVWLGWWVPVVSLWFPLQIVDDVRKSTARDEPRPSLAMWWFAWLVAMWAGQISGRVFNSAEVLSHDAIVVVSILDTVVAVATVFACIKWIGIIRGITRDQESARS